MAEYLRSAEEFDYGIMETHRRRVEELVADPATAEILKPYYRYLCKRPCFHDEYLPAFNNPNVTLIDCPAGIERITEQGPVVDGQQYEVDCIIYGTGFEAELTPLFRRAGHEIVGRGGVTLAEKWADGAASLFGMMSRGFPNMFVMPAPGQQAVVTVNYTQLAVLGAEFIGGAVGLLEQQGVEVFDVSAEAEEAWTQKIVDTYVDSSAVMSACTPSRINNEGHPEALNPRNGNYGRGLGRLVRLPRAARAVARGRHASRAWSSRSGRRHRERAPAGRRRDRRRGRDRSGDRRGARPWRLVRRHRRPPGDPRRLRAAPRAGGDHRRSHRGGGWLGPGLVGVGDRRRGGPRPVPGAGRRARRARRRRQRGRHHPADLLRAGHRGGLAGGARTCTSGATSTCSTPRCRSWPPPGTGASSASPPARGGGPPMPAPTAAPSGPLPPSPGSWAGRRRRASPSTPCRPSPPPGWSPRPSSAPARRASRAAVAISVPLDAGPRGPRAARRLPRR